MSCDPITKMSKLKPPLQVRTSCPAIIPPTKRVEVAPPDPHIVSLLLLHQLPFTIGARFLEKTSERLNYSPEHKKIILLWRGICFNPLVNIYKGFNQIQELGLLCDVFE